MRLWLIIILVLFISNAYGSEVGKTEFPESINQLTKDIQGKQPNEVRNIILTRFGSADRDIGSGLLIEQWDIEGGILTFHPTVGPAFASAEGTSCWLLRTTNRVVDNLIGSFEMFSLSEQDPYAIGNEFWLGNLHLDKTGRFYYIDSGQFSKQKNAFPKNFFLLNREGQYSIKFAKGISGDSLLEEFSDRTTICIIKFVSKDENKLREFNIISSQSSRMLFFDRDQPITFEMHKGWKNYWNYQKN